VIIFWNAERFLRQAVDSVLCQTYSQWELLLVDDGSTDGSAALAQSFASATPGRIRYLTHPGRVNRGMSASRNLGFHNAAGHFIALLDADDQWVLDKLEHQVPIMLRYPEAAMLYAPAQYWHPDDPSQDFIQDIGFLEQTVCAPPTLARQFLRDSAGTPSTGGLLLRADHVRRLAGLSSSFGACTRTRRSVSSSRCRRQSLPLQNRGADTVNMPTHVAQSGLPTASMQTRGDAFSPGARRTFASSASTTRPFAQFWFASAGRSAGAARLSPRRVVRYDT
jgi:glycosyltransferase involved in cell wall biosynthesis